MYTWSDTESQPCPLASTPRSQGAVEENVTHQWQQHAEDIPVEKPQVMLSMCSVKLTIILIPRLNKEEGKTENKAAHFLRC